MIAAAQLRSCGKLAPTRPPSTFPQPPQLRRRANVLTMSLDDSVSYLPGTYGAGGGGVSSRPWHRADSSSTGPGPRPVR
jgi:hypothetical protein